MMPSHILDDAINNVIVRVNEFVAGIVRRVDVNHLHLAQVRLLEQLQYLQVVAFDNQVLRGIEVHAFFRARTERAEARRQAA